MESLRDSEIDWNFRIHLIETNSNLTQDGWDYGTLVHRVVQPKIPFNYNQYLNLVLPEFNTDFVVIVNNDVLFHRNWFTEITRQILECELDSASPRCPRWEAHRPYDDEGVYTGFDSGVHFCGWCLVLRQSTLRHILPLDEAFSFWFQDNDLAQYLRCTRKRHALVSSSLVTHLESQSHELLDKDALRAQTMGLRQVFADKWGC